MPRQAKFKHLNWPGQWQEKPRLGVDTMQRFALMIRLKPGSEERYKRYHAAVWPEVLSMIQDCKIRNCRFRKIWHSSFRKFWHARR